MALFSVAQGSHCGKTQRDVNSGDLTLDVQFAIQLRTKYTPRGLCWRICAKITVRTHPSGRSDRVFMLSGRMERP